jgi:[CysO sulfur-carrier protein]-S-L-cysteine hydrolase
VFDLPRDYADEIIGHAREEAPTECCGILAGKDGRALRLYRATNAERSPHRYDIGAEELYRIHSEVESLGWEFVAIYHSHPSGEAYPSPRDVAEAYWPDAVYLIVSLADAASPRIRAFRLRDGAVSEEDLCLTD